MSSAPTPREEREIFSQPLAPLPEEAVSSELLTAAAAQRFVTDRIEALAHHSPTGKIRRLLQELATAGRDQEKRLRGLAQSIDPRNSPPGSVPPLHEDPESPGGTTREMGAHDVAPADQFGVGGGCEGDQASPVSLPDERA
jgi:hypothetical protein